MQNHALNARNHTLLRLALAIYVIICEFRTVLPTYISTYTMYCTRPILVKPDETSNHASRSFFATLFEAPIFVPSR